MNEEESEHKKTNRRAAPDEPQTAASVGAKTKGLQSREVGGRHGPDPVRYGDWEKNGRCIDF